jgi:hypothetical protein
VRLAYHFRSLSAAGVHPFVPHVRSCKCLLLAAVLLCFFNSCIGNGDTNIASETNGVPAESSSDNDDDSTAQQMDEPEDEPEDEPGDVPEDEPSAAAPEPEPEPASSQPADDELEPGEPTGDEPEPTQPALEPAPEPVSESDDDTSSGDGDCDTAGTDFDEAFDVGGLTELFECEGFADAGEGDHFRFELTGNGQLNYTLDSTGVVTAKLYRDATQINRATPLNTLPVNGAPQTLKVTLQRGVYYLAVSAAGKIFDLGIGVEYYEPVEPLPDPGEDFDVAMDLGEVGSERIDVGGFVGTTDEADVFRVEVPTNGVLTYTIGDIVGNVTAALYEDAAQINLTTPRASHSNLTGDNTAPPIDLAEGIYYLRITPAVDSLFTLSLSFE